MGYPVALLKAQLLQSVSALAWVASTPFHPCGVVVIGFRNGSVRRSNFFWDIHTDNALLPLCCGFPGIRSRGPARNLGDGQYFFVDIGQTILTTERTPNAAPAEKRDGGSSRSS
ncbi:hypothetical protein B0H14DRAFT_3173276 [Mycena olivaceomarginata]|nr:hypothetical protein B0H14DRAFT_3173276 [Mycena olivaceomarginata]